MAKRHFEIATVFSKWLGAKARELVKTTPGFELIDINDFPEGAPIHEDGSSEYDPRKPLALFAVCLTSAAAIQAWDAACREHDRLIAA